MSGNTKQGAHGSGIGAYLAVFAALMGLPP